MLAELLSDIGDREFKWGEWDCFKLASYIRTFNNLPEFPNFDHIYKRYNEYNFPPTKLTELLSQNCVEITPGNIQNFDLVCLEFQMTDNLSTYYDGRLIYMGYKLVVNVEYSMLFERVKNIWRY